LTSAARTASRIGSHRLSAAEVLVATASIIPS
jgi:hypothetical protein